MAQGLTPSYGPLWGLTDTTGALVGLFGPDGREYLINVSANTPARAAQGLTSLGAPGAIGGTTAGAGTFTALRVAAGWSLQQAIDDRSGTPGSVSVGNQGRGRVAFAAGTNSIVVTNGLVTATATILLSLGGTDATLTSVRVTPGAGSFTITGNANATGITPCDYVVVAQ